jgi:diguanylate cyclase (GGDEF)-like protein
LVFVDLRKRDRRSRVRSNRAEVETRVQRALEMAHTEERAYGVLEDALDLIVPGLAAEFLVADSSRAHFHQVVSINATEGAGCPVSAPSECPVAGSGQTRVFANSTDLDACPYLRDRAAGPCAGECSAVCIPVSITGKTVGVIHTIGTKHHFFDRETVANLELVARRAGERIGMLRAFSRSQTQAQTDPLTGLLNRRSLEDETRGLVEGGDRYVVAYGDLDHFKMLNDVHGHDAGDRALRLFARILRDNVRPNDLPARYGGEEFVVVLPACSIDQAKEVIERIRTRLAASFETGAVATFTVSFGLAASDPSLTFGEVIDIADGALLSAKAAGRNRVIVANDPDASGHDPLSDPSLVLGSDADPLDDIPAEVHGRAEDLRG